MVPVSLAVGEFSGRRVVKQKMSASYETKDPFTQLSVFFKPIFRPTQSLKMANVNICLPFSRYFIGRTAAQVRTLYSPAYLGIDKFNDTQYRIKRLAGENSKSEQII